MITNKKIVIILILIFLVLILYIKQIKIKKEHLEIDDTLISDLTKIYFSNIKSESNYINTKISNNLLFSFEDVDFNLNNKLCFSPGKCITGEMINTLNNSGNSGNTVNNYMYLPNSLNKIDNNIIWNDIFSQINPDNNRNGAVKAIGDTWDLGYNTTKWNNKYIYQLKNGKYLQIDGSGVEITVPPRTADMTEDFSVLWIQALNDNNTQTGIRWSTFKVYDYTNPSNIRSFGKHVVGGNKLDNISPDGSTSNVRHNGFAWWPVPIDLSGNISRRIMVSTFYATYPNHSTWYSGFAFSTNPWNHCQVNAKSLIWQVNSLDATGRDISGIVATPQSTVIWVADSWNERPLLAFVSNTTTEFRIPFVNSQKDKIFYIIEHNNNWGPAISYLEIKTISGSWIKIGNLYTTFDNPFARHNNSKIFNRYYGIVIPKAHLPIKGTSNDNFIILRLTIPKNDGNGLYIREVGTHDVSPF
jgi:hypothetical protein